MRYNLIIALNFPYICLSEPKISFLLFLLTQDTQCDHVFSNIYHKCAHVIINQQHVKVTQFNFYCYFDNHKSKCLVSFFYVEKRIEKKNVFVCSLLYVSLNKTFLYIILSYLHLEVVTYSLVWKMATSDPSFFTRCQHVAKGDQEECHEEQYSVNSLFLLFLMW
jgi:hypothetical protein